MNKQKKKPSLGGRILKGILIFLCSCLLLGSICGCFLIFGPIEYLRELWITTAMDTFHHQYLATWFFTQEYIDTVLQRNAPVVNPDEFDPSLIDLTGKETGPSSETDTDTAEEPATVIDPLVETETEHIPTRDEVITVEDVSRRGSAGYYVGYMMIVKDPTLVRVGVAENLGRKGEKLVNMVPRLNAWAGMNAGGFTDAEGMGNGGQAEGIVMKDGEIISNNRRGGKHDVIGITYDGLLVLKRMTEKELKESNIRDCVEFDPFLIVNGVSTKVGVTGIHPRAAIGQRADGAFLFLIIDGRSTASAGATQKDVIEVMEEYGAVNCANLDGGSSATLVLGDKILNKPSSASKTGRTLATAFIVMSPEELAKEQ